MATVYKEDEKKSENSPARNDGRDLKTIEMREVGLRVQKSLGWKDSFERKLDIRGFGRMPQFNE
jgi:hypothetical protein